MSRVLLSFPDVGEFVYDPLRPTYYTEYLSWATHKHQAALSSAGAAVEVETRTPLEQAGDIAAFSSNLSTFIDSVVSGLSSWLNGEPDMEKPVLPALPEIPAGLENAISLLPGGKIGLALKVGVSLLSGWSKWQDSMRERDPVRLLDKAFFDNGWFQTMLGRQSYLDKIAENLSALSTSGVNVDLQPLIDVLSAQDCNNTQVSIAQVLFRALGECREIGEGYSAYYGLFEVLNQIATSLSMMSIEIETEKAARVKMSGIECQETIPFPSNL